VCLTYPEGVAGQWNHFEADLTIGLATLLEEQLSAAIPGQTWIEGLGVVTPHRAQKALLQAGLRNTYPTVADEIDKAVDTVERFQGQERWAILATYAVGDPDTVAEEDEFLQSLNRFNVLATRARAKLVVVLSDEVVAHIASDIDVINDSRLLKSFAHTFCANRSRLVVGHTAPNGVARDVEMTMRWR
jgi:hypothetical protein